MSLGVQIKCLKCDLHQLCWRWSRNFSR